MGKVAWHTIDITGVGDDSRVIAFHRTNDDLDDGYPGGFVSWIAMHVSIEEALRINGKTRQENDCRVTVTVNGEVV